MLARLLVDREFFVRSLKDDLLDAAHRYEAENPALKPPGDRGDKG